MLFACITLASSVNSSVEEGNLGRCPFFHFSSFKLDALLRRDHRPSLDELLDWSEAKLQLLCWLRSSIWGKKETTFSTTKKEYNIKSHIVATLNYLVPDIKQD